jgi:hypothetical protein
MVGGRTIRLRGPRLYLQVRTEAVDDFERQPGGFLRPPTGPNDDSLVIENLVAGRYWLRLSSTHGYVASATMGGVDLLHDPLVVTAGSSAPIEITMRDDNAEIDGTAAGITTGATTTSAPAYVYCVPLPDSSGQFQLLQVSPEGKLYSQMMAPGTYRVIAFKNQQPNLAYRDAEAMRTYETKGQVVHLSPGQKTTLQLQIVSGSE